MCNAASSERRRQQIAARSIMSRRGRRAVRTGGGRGAGEERRRGHGGWGRVRQRVCLSQRRQAARPSGEFAEAVNGWNETAAPVLDCGQMEMMTERGVPMHRSSQARDENVRRHGQDCVDHAPSNDPGDEYGPVVSVFRPRLLLRVRVPITAKYNNLVN